MIKTAGMTLLHLLFDNVFRGLLECPGLVVVNANRIPACPIIPHITPWSLSPQFLILVALDDLVALSLWEWRVVAVFVVFKVLCDTVIVVHDVVSYGWSGGQGSVGRP